MLETHLHSPVTQRRLRTGLAADHIDAFTDWLHRNGYKPISITALLRSLAGWTDWMCAAGFTAQAIVAGFEACKVAMQGKQRHRRVPNRHSLTAARVFIRFFQNQGVLPPPVSPPSATDRWPMLGEFRSWMRQHRGLTETTLDVYPLAKPRAELHLGANPQEFRFHLHVVSAISAVDTWMPLRARNSKSESKTRTCARPNATHP